MWYGTLLLLSFLLQSFNCDLKLGAFNIKTFGWKKYSDVQVRKTLLSIVSGYDLIVIQEIRDKSNTMIFQFLLDLREVSSPSWDLVVSPRLGRSSRYQEQYAVFYNRGKLEVQGQFVYSDSGGVYERPPLVAHFKVRREGALVTEFTVIALHAAPGSVVAELEEVPGVYREARKRGYPSLALLMGDLNADCTYLADKDRRDLGISQEKQELASSQEKDESGSSHEVTYTWLVNEDTAVSPQRDCVYDRIIVCSQGPGPPEMTGHVHKFDTDMEYDFAKGVSDHYPVYTILPTGFEEDFKPGLCVTGGFICCLSEGVTYVVQNIAAKISHYLEVTVKTKSEL